MDNQDQNNGINSVNDIKKVLNNLQNKVANTTTTIDNAIKTQNKTINKKKTYLGSFRLSSVIALLYLIFMTIVGIIDFISDSNIKLLVDLLPYWGIVIGISYGGLSIINYMKK